MEVMQPEAYKKGGGQGGHHLPQFWDVVEVNGANPQPQNFELVYGLDNTAA